MIVLQSSPRRFDVRQRRERPRKEINEFLLEIYNGDYVEWDYVGFCLRSSEIEAIIDGNMSDHELIEADAHLKVCDTCYQHLRAAEESYAADIEDERRRRSGQSSEYDLDDWLDRDLDLEYLKAFEDGDHFSLRP
jgi:hypothetical protein